VTAVRWGMPVPSHWPRTRVKYVCRFVGGGTPDKGNIEYWNGEIPWVSPKDMKSSEVVNTEDHITKAGLDSSAAKLVETGAVLIVMRSGILRHSIPVAINRVPVTLNQDMRALIPASALEPRYLARLIEGHQRQFLNVWSKEGTTVESLESDLVADTEIAMPPLLQQRAIADYLDRETAQLDELVAAKERVLGLVAEKRRALITRAVTRGLDPGAPFRDSGIPWLGEIPAHWDVQRLKFLVPRIEQGWSPECHNVPASDEEWGVLKAGCCNGGMFNQQENKSLPLNLAPPLDLEVKPGDIVMSRASGSTELIGSVALVPEGTRSRLLLSDKTYRILLDTTRATQSYFVIALGSDVGRVQVQEVVSGAAGLANNIAQGDIKEFAIPLPPVDEQVAIVDYITAETAKLDALRAATERTIALLKERRAALIAATVTGKINVQREIT
jgi:type I restriction enzyme S subunit